MFRFMDERLPTKTILARNLAYLMKDRGWNQKETARRAGVDQKVISYIINERKSPGVDTVDSIAAAFGLNLWHLIMPTLIEDLSSDTSIRDVYEAFSKASSEGRRHIRQVAEREAEYNKEAS